MKYYEACGCGAKISIDHALDVYHLEKTVKAWRQDHMEMGMHKVHSLYELYPPQVSTGYEETIEPEENTEVSTPEDTGDL